MSCRPLAANYYMTRKHQPFCLPTELEDVEYTTLPLYILVALWALRQNKAVTVRDVRNAFDLSLRRARDVLEYLTEQGEGIVEASCNLRPVGIGDRRVRREWLVKAVYGERARVSKTLDSSVTSTRMQNPPSSRGISDAGRWFLRRCTGETVPGNFSESE